MTLKSEQSQKQTIHSDKSFDIIELNVLLMHKPFYNIYKHAAMIAKLSNNIKPSDRATVVGHSAREKGKISPNF